jgi:putative transposase
MSSFAQCFGHSLNNWFPLRMSTPPNGWVIQRIGFPLRMRTPQRVGHTENWHSPPNAYPPTGGSYRELAFPTECVPPNGWVIQRIGIPHRMSTPPNGWVPTSGLRPHQIIAYPQLMHLKHYDHDGRARFITFCTHRRLPVLDSSEFRDILQSQMLDMCRDQSVTILAFVIMPEHVHLVLVPPISMKMGLFVGELKRVSAKTLLERLRETQPARLREYQVVRDKKTKLAIWQRRCFDHNCRNDTEVWKAVEYCHYNPVTRGLVKDPAEWKWSSHNWYESG